MRAEYGIHTLADSYVLYIIAMNVHTSASSYFTSQYSSYMADISLMPSVVITHIRVIILLVYILTVCSEVNLVLHTYTVCTEFTTHILAHTLISMRIITLIRVIILHGYILVIYADLTMETGMSSHTSIVSIY